MNRQEIEQMIDEDFGFLSEIERCNFKKFILDKLLPEVLRDILDNKVGIVEKKIKEKYNITL